MDGDGRKQQPKRTCKARVSPAQIEMILHFIEEHPDIAVPASDLRPGFSVTTKSTLWGELVALLNAAGSAVKSREEWQHFWASCVRKAKQKAAEFRSSSG